MSPVHCHFQVRDSWNNVAWPCPSQLVKSQISPNMIYALNKKYVVLSSLFLIQVFTFRCTLHMQEFRSDWYGSFEKFQTMKDDYMCLLYMKNFNGSKNLFGLRRPLCQWGGELARRWQEGVGGAGGEGVNLCFPQSILNLGGQGRLLRKPSDPDHGRRRWLGILQQQRRLLLWQQRLWGQPGIDMQKVQT